MRRKSRIWKSYKGWFCPNLNLMFINYLAVKHSMQILLLYEYQVDTVFLCEIKFHAVIWFCWGLWVSQFHNSVLWLAPIMLGDWITFRPHSLNTCLGIWPTPKMRFRKMLEVHGDGWWASDISKTCKSIIDCEKVTKCANYAKVTITPW